jgi:hypothetical protein
MLKVTLAADSAKSRKHYLFRTNSEHVLLIDESAPVACLIDSGLHLNDSTDAGPTCVGRPVIPG